jgi:hypothetical protein
MSDAPDKLPATIRNEFAMVEIKLIPGASGPRLEITDVAGGVSASFDALELEGMCWLTDEQRRTLLDPELRWSDD